MTPSYVAFKILIDCQSIIEERGSEDQEVLNSEASKKSKTKLKMETNSASKTDIQEPTLFPAVEERYNNTHLTVIQVTIKEADSENNDGARGKAGSFNYEDEDDKCEQELDNRCENQTGDLELSNVDVKMEGDKEVDSGNDGNEGQGELQSQQSDGQVYKEELDKVGNDSQGELQSRQSDDQVYKEELDDEIANNVSIETSSRFKRVRRLPERFRNGPGESLEKQKSSKKAKSVGKTQVKMEEQDDPSREELAGENLDRSESDFDETDSEDESEDDGNESEVEEKYNPELANDIKFEFDETDSENDESEDNGNESEVEEKYSPELANDSDQFQIEGKVAKETCSRFGRMRREPSRFRETSHLEEKVSKQTSKKKMMEKRVMARMKSSAHNNKPRKPQLLTSYKCKHCSEMCKSPNIFYKHLKKEHLGVLEETLLTKKKVKAGHIINANSERKVFCKICNLALSSFTVRHHRVPHPKTMKTVPQSQNQSRHSGISVFYQCKQCSKSCQTKREFQEHYSQAHIELCKGSKHLVNISESATCLCRCCECNWVFEESKKENHLEYHKKLKKKVNKTCKICNSGKLLNNLYEWETHMAEHGRERKRKEMKRVEKLTKWAHQCKLCWKSFDCSKKLEVHLRLHSDDRPFMCDVCGKSFKKSSALCRHRAIHSNVKPLSCEFCGKGFSNGYNLKGHLRTHTGEKPFKCDDCGAAFTYNVSLKTHKKSAHGINMWKGQKPQKLKEFSESYIEKAKGNTEKSRYNLFLYKQKMKSK